MQPKRRTNSGEKLFQTRLTLVPRLGACIPVGSTGINFRLVWQHGMSDAELGRYAAIIFELFDIHRKDGSFPEWRLQELDQNWMQEFPSQHELARNPICIPYVRYLMSGLGSGAEKSLERLGHYLLGAMPSCRALARQRTHSTDYDIVCTLEGPEIDFRSELGRYFLCECRDWAKPADFTVLVTFCRVLDSVKCRFGILFSKEGISGAGKTTDAEREQLKIFQDRGIVIIVVSLDDLSRVARGVSFTAMLREKYETSPIRFTALSTVFRSF